MTYMEQLAQSDFFYYHIAPNLPLMKALFFFGIFALVGVVAQSVRLALEEEAESELFPKGK